MENQVQTKVISELKRIAQKNHGLLQPETVVDEARPTTSPLHPQFEWDDSTAAQQHRLWQARQLISVCVETVEGMKDQVPVFVSLTPDRLRKGGGYRLTMDVLSSKEAKEQMLSDAHAELECFQRKYQRLRELAMVFKAIRSIRKKK